MTVEIALSRDDAASVTKAADGSWEICPDLSYVRLAIVNIVFYGQPGGDQPWVLIDTGLGTSSQSIGQCAERRFGGRSPRLFSRVDISITSAPPPRCWKSGIARLRPCRRTSLS